MDFHRSKPEGHRPPVSVLEGEGSYFRKILSREPSIGNSNGHYRYRSPGRIPFQWERQPGKCKFDPSKEDPVDVLRINPPPISTSRSVEMPSRPNHGGGPKGSSSSWLKMRFWRKIKNKKPQSTMPGSKNEARGSQATSECVLNGSSRASGDDSLMSSSSNSSSSSTSSSSLSFAAPS